MKQYLELLKKIQTQGTVKADRTGTGTTSIFGHQMRFDLNEGFPLVTTKTCHLRSIIHELLWFLNGETNIRYLNDNGVRIWDEWADENGDLGPVYGKQWRDWTQVEFGGDREQRLADGWIEKGVMAADDPICVWKKSESTVWYKTIDQISVLMDTLENDPDSRRMIVNSWNVGELGSMALTPCHALFQLYTTPMSLQEREEWMRINDPENEVKYRTGRGVPEGMVGDNGNHLWIDKNTNTPRRRLSCQLYQRSCDVFLGLPFNIASYALLTHMLAQQLNFAVGEFVWTGGDTHIYKNHHQQVAKQLLRTPRALPKLNILRKPGSIFDYKFEDFEVVGYDPHPAIRGKVSV